MFTYVYFVRSMQKDYISRVLSHFSIGYSQSYPQFLWIEPPRRLKNTRRRGVAIY